MIMVNNRLIVMLLIELLILVAPLLFILADLASGLRKAKVRGERIMSNKLRRTVNKMAKYYNVLLTLAVIDALQLACLWYLDTYYDWSMPLFPWLTLLGSAGVGFIETKSIMEPADKKEATELKQISVLAKAIADHRTDPDEIAKAVIDYLNAANNEQRE